MKIIKYLFPIILVLLFGASVNNLFQSRMEEQSTYQNLVIQARDYHEQGILLDAEKYYLAAAEHKPSVEIYTEVFHFYEDVSQKSAIKWGKKFMEDYPNEIRPYELMTSFYDAQEDYIQCFVMADDVAKRGLQSDVIDEILQKNQYCYYFNGEFDDVGAFMGNRCPIQLEDHWGFSSDRGTVAVSAHFVHVGPFMQDLAPVTDSDGNCYFIDLQGNKKHTMKDLANISELGMYSAGHQTVCIDGKWGYYNENNDCLFGGYLEAYPFFNDIAAVQTTDGWMLINLNGENITGQMYDDVKADGNLTACRNDRLFVVSGGICKMIDTAGNPVGTDVYEDAEIFYNWDSYAAVKKNGTWSFIDKNGVSPFEASFEDARSFSNGLAAVKQNGKWGFIDLEGNIVIEPQFVDARDFNGKGAAFVKTGRVWQLLRLVKDNYN